MATIYFPDQEYFDRQEAMLKNILTELSYLRTSIDSIHKAKRYSREEAAEQLGMSVQTLDQRRKAGLIGYIAGKPIIHTHEHIEEYRKRFNIPALKIQ